MSVEGLYVQALRRAQDIYICDLCMQRNSNQRAPISGRKAFREHLQTSHGDEIREQSTRQDDFDLKTWEESLENRSRTSGRQKTPETGTPADDLKNMSLASKKTSSPRRNRSQDNKYSGQSRGNPRRSGRGEGQTHQLNRSATLNWEDGEPSRTLFDPRAGEGSSPKAASNVAQPSTDASSRATAPPYTPTSSQHSQTPASERGVLKVSTANMVPQPTQQTGIAMPTDPRWPSMLLQPDSRPISQEQLAAEVKSIYAGLTMVESKCIHVDKAQAQAIRDKSDARITQDHWQALIALHKTLLHEHHDFFLASQHPSASPALRRLALKYSMPARMWKHGIHSFLELLRYRLPGSLEFMVNFIYTAYQMMALLYETVPAFENTWIECLGDLGRYRMAIEDESVRDRENWAEVARMWYTKAADRSPEVGRLYHHLAILARPNALQQLSLYSRSLIAVHIFHSARESILTLFNPLVDADATTTHVSQIDFAFIKACALIFNKGQRASKDDSSIFNLSEQFRECRDRFLELLDTQIGRVTAKWREQGAFIIIALLGGLFDYGNDGPLRRAFNLGFHKLGQKLPAPPRIRQGTTGTASAESKTSTADGDSTMEDLAQSDTVDEKTQIAFDNTLEFFSATITAVTNRKGDNNVLPFLHILSTFLLALYKVQETDPQVKSSYVVTSVWKALPRRQICAYLNTLTQSDPSNTLFASDDFIRSEKGDDVPLPEDYLIRGQVYSQLHFPTDWFKTNGAEDEEKNMEHASTMQTRIVRVKNQFYRLSLRATGFLYDTATQTWMCDEDFMPIIRQSGPPKINAAALQSPTSADLNMLDINDDDSGFESTDDSPQENALRKENKMIKASNAKSSTDTSMLCPPEAHRGGSDEPVRNLVSKDMTYMVFDHQTIVQHNDLVTLLVQERFTIAMSNKNLYDLNNMSEASLPAREALKNVHKAFTQRTMRVLNADGKDIATEHFAEVQSMDKQNESDTSMMATDDQEEEILGVVRRATAHAKDDLHRPDHEHSPYQALLLTDSVSTRRKAAGERIPAASPGSFMKFWETTRKKVVQRMRSFSDARSRRSSVSKEASPTSAHPEKSTLDYSGDRMEIE